MDKYYSSLNKEGEMNMENLRIVEEEKEDERVYYHIERINEKLSWPANSMLACFVCKEKKIDLNKALKSYKILDIGSKKTKIVSLLDYDNIVYKSN
jgi:activator of 2-hydroxyglutaryl-CoA dehydratase